MQDKFLGITPYFVSARGHIERKRIVGVTLPRSKTDSVLMYVPFLDCDGEPHHAEYDPCKYPCYVKFDGNLAHEGLNIDLSLSMSTPERVIFADGDTPKEVMRLAIEMYVNAGRSKKFCRASDEYSYINVIVRD